METTRVLDEAAPAARRGAMSATPILTAPGVFSLLVPPPREPAVISLWHAMMVTASAQRKRGSEEDDHTSSGSEDQHESHQKKKKKPTYVARKEEKALLEQEVRDLEARAEKLREAAGVSGLAAVSAQLRNSVEQQQLAIASAQSVFSEFTNNQRRSPIECFIHLTSDWRQRQATLMALRGPKTDLARRFLAARTRFVHPTRVSSEVSKFQQEDGSFCTVKLTVTPFHGLRSAKQVYDALMFYFFNIEISISELTGSTTVNENYRESTTEPLGSGESECSDNSTGVLCHRLVTDLHDGLVVEKNSIQFLSYHDPSESSRPAPSADGFAGEEFALMTSDFANLDELYPYVPDTRLRKDINTVLRISSHRERSPEGENELVVVLTYWTYIKTHASKLTDRKLTTHQLERVHDELVHAMDILPVSIRHSLYGVE